MVGNKVQHWVVHGDTWGDPYVSMVCEVGIKWINLYGNKYEILICKDRKDKDMKLDRYLNLYE